MTLSSSTTIEPLEAPFSDEVNDVLLISLIYFSFQEVLNAHECRGLFGVRSGFETGPVCCIHSYQENLIKAVRALRREPDLDITPFVSCFKHAAWDLLAGTMEAERRGT